MDDELYEDDEPIYFDIIPKKRKREKLEIKY
jgi:hypothetical protein